MEAKQLIEKLNRRMGAIEFLTGEHLRQEGMLRSELPPDSVQQS
ncbi:MAG TPA: hypothetical protein PKH24_00780 [Sedimentisphaerales bacterium]|nr:hypothetical protein [Sedimentisphaerales bacterium]HNU27939.1 hypothetical protein [Sedimentisphaerales bacterium]